MRLHSQLAVLVCASVIAAPAITAAAAQAPDTVAVKLVVTPNHTDWLYRTGDSARFTISLMRDGKLVPHANVRVAFGEVRMRTTRVDTVDVSLGPQRLYATLDHPGFVRATVMAVVGGVTYTSMATAGFSPEQIRAATTMPTDFREFWQNAIADARRTPLAPKMTRLPQYSTPDVDVYHINFQNQNATSRIYGMLSVPTKPGKYP
ncbi:MAG: acetylxylan esterase, partial [Gemmatimonadota bacterium]|nr:acetylxylan esterase [Gemmatimonadota bacterium]